MSARPTTRPTTRPITNPNLARGKRNRRTTQRTNAVARVAARRAAGRLVSVLFGVGALGGLAAAGQYGWRCLRDAPRLQVQSIEVRGSTRVQWEELEAYTKLHVGDPILGLDLDGIAVGLRRHPWIAQASVRRRLPDHVVIDVVEHEPRILVSLGDLYVADADGHLFKRLQAKDRIVLPVITGLGREWVAAQADHGADVIRDGIALSASLAGADVAGALGTVEELHWDRDLGWSVVFGPSRRAVRVHLGRSPIERIELAVAAMERLGRLGRRPREIWADGPDHRRQVQVALRSTPTDPSEQQPTLIAKAGD